MIEPLRLALRTARRAFRTSIGVTGTALLTLAIAAGLNIAMFGVIDRAVLSPPPQLVDPDRLFTVGFEIPDAETGAPRGQMTTTSYVTFDQIREQAAEAAAWQRSSTAAMIDGSQVNVDTMLVSGSYFRLLGARPRLGRAIVVEDDTAPAGSPVAVVSHDFWRRSFGGDPGVLGRRIRVRGAEFTIVGVMPPGFSGHSSTRVDLWLPFHAGMKDPGWDRNPFINIASIVIRLPREATTASISANLSTVTSRRAALSPLAGTGVSSTEQRIAFWLAAVSILVLAIGLANAATLLLVRAAARRREMAIRLALGATRTRLHLHGIVEAALLSLVATLIALVLSGWLEGALRSVLLPSVAESAPLNVRVLFVATVTGLLSFLVIAVTGAIKTSGAALVGNLADAARVRPRRRTHVVLLLVQTALSVVLLAGAGLFAQSLYKLGAQDFGMRTDDVLLVEFDRGPGSANMDEVFLQAIERIAALPGVALVTPIKTIPFTGFNVPPISVPGLAGPPNVDGQLPFLTAATPQFFDILGITVVEGRRFVDRDDRGAPVVIVNQTMARSLWPGQSAIGKCIRIGFEPTFDPFTAAGPPPPPTTVPCREVIGVAGDLRQRSVVPTGSEARLMQYFVPFSQVPPPPHGVNPGQRPEVYGLLLRATVTPDRLAPAIRRTVVGDRADLPFLHVRRYADLLERQMRPWRLGTTLLVMFGALALGVAAIGLYAAFAHAVSERRHEMAIRLAIGARPRRVLTMILGEAAVVAAIGTACGSGLVVLAGPALQSLLFDTAASDLRVLGAAAILMLGIAAIATLLPAITASRSNPASLLRAE